MRVFITLLSLCGATVGHAQVVEPSAIEAIELAGDRNWDAAVAASAAEDAVTRDVVTWLRLRAGEAEFAEYRAFVKTNADWPRLDRLRKRGEEMIEKGHDPSEVLLWFGDIRPQTGIGAVRLAEALIARGQLTLAKDVIETAWLELRLTDEDQEAILAGFADVVAPLHVQRVDALLWRWRTDDAKRMLPLLEDDQRALAAARLAYITKSGNAAGLAAEVPEALQDTAGLAYDRYNYLSDKGSRTDAIAILRARSVSAESLGEPFRWSGWRRSLARWEMREGRAESAYELATKHYLTDGSAFADLEWLAGYLALRYLDRPEDALTHFAAARAAVDSPISVGRMAYWTGRTLDELGQPSDAAYREAAQHQTSFYGLLAAEKLGLSLDPALTGQADPRDWQGSDVLDHKLVRAGLTLLEGGERGAAITFFAHLGQVLEADDLSRLGALLEDMDESYFELLLGKTAVRRDIRVMSNYFPIHALAEMDLPTSTALAMSIARRESEFNAVVGSPVGALGLMQLMPATAEEVSGIIGERYSRAKLTADWPYNARLGSKYLAMLEEQFGPSPVMIAAGYNAGPSRPSTWMAERGDPRVGKADVIDWIEHIPFRETRNYVQRVTESIPVYEARLTGIANPIQFTELLIGRPPFVRPLARPTRDVPATE